MALSVHSGLVAFGTVTVIPRRVPPVWCVTKQREVQFDLRPSSRCIRRSPALMDTALLRPSRDLVLLSSFRIAKANDLTKCNRLLVVTRFVCCCQPGIDLKKKLAEVAQPPHKRMLYPNAVSVSCVGSTQSQVDLSGIERIIGWMNGRAWTHEPII